MIGTAILFLIASMLLYGVAHADVKMYRRLTMQTAFFFMIWSAFVSSGGLIGNLVLLHFPDGSKTSLYWIAFLGYPIIGAILAVWFCLSRF